jgi:hypothetical protein
METTGSVDAPAPSVALTAQSQQRPPPSADDNTDEKCDQHHSSDKPPEPIKSSSAVVALPNPAPGAKKDDLANWEFEPPLANIRRLLKHTLPKGTNISKGEIQIAFCLCATS